MEIVKRYFNNLYFEDYSKRRGVYDYHTVMVFALAVNGIVMNKKNRRSPVRFIYPFVSLGLGVVGIAFMGIYISHCLEEKDIPNASESIAYLLILVAVIIQGTCIILGRNYVYRLGEMMDGDFAEIETADEDYRMLFYNNQVIIKKLTIMWLAFISAIMISFMGKTFLEILYQQLIAENIVEKLKPFMYKIWLPYDDVYRTPIYEVFTCLQYLLTFFVVTVFGSYTLIQVHYNMHVICQFDLVILGWRKLFQFDDLPGIELHRIDDARTIQYIHNLLQKRIKEISIIHKRGLEFFDIVNSLLGPVLVYQILITSLALCICGFQIAHGLENGELNFLFLLLFIGSVVQIWIPSMLASKILQKGSDVGDACYSCGWERMKISHEISLEIQFFLLRANLPVITKAMKIMVVSLEKFQSIMSTGGSYFTMLRQVNEDIYK